MAKPAFFVLLFLLFAVQLTLQYGDYDYEIDKSKNKTKQDIAKKKKLARRAARKEEHARAAAEVYNFFDTYVSYRWIYDPESTTYQRLSGNTTLPFNEAPLVYKHFDIVAGYPPERGKIYPFNVRVPPAANMVHLRSLFCLSSNIAPCLKIISKVPPLNVTMHQKRSLVFGGSDYHLDKVYSQIMDATAAKQFSTIWFEAKNIYTPHIKTLPMGFIPSFVAISGEDSIRKAIDYSFKYKTSAYIGHQALACTPFGVITTSQGDFHIDDRVKLNDFMQSDAGEALISKPAVPWTLKSHWAHLRNCTFALLPMGTSIQTTRIFEALMVKTVPVVTPNPAHLDLVAQGFPLLVVDKWQALNKTMLMDWFSGRYGKINWKLVQSKLTVKYAIKNIVNS